MAPSRKSKGAGDYAREALSEWGKAARHGARAVAGGRKPKSTGDHKAASGDGGPLAGLAGKAMSLVSAGGGSSPVPIDASVDVAVPAPALFEVCTSFGDYPEFMDAVEEVEAAGDSELAVVVDFAGRRRELEIELLDEWPDERLDWECTSGIEHSGTVSFHRVAPRLTRLELTIEHEPEGVLDRLLRRIHLPDRAIQAELHRLKAHAEFSMKDFEEEQDEEPEDEEELEEDDDELEDEEDLEDEEELDEDEEDLEDEEEDFDEDEDEELEGDEELEPAGAER